MTVETAVNIAPLERLVTAGVLLMLRVGSAVATAPVFSSTAVPVRVKAVFTLVVTILLVPVASAMQGAMPVLSVATMLSETAVGLCFGLTLALLTEALLFAGSLMGVAFSFSLVNLMDPNSHVETDVLGTIFGWLGVLVLVSAGLHRTLLAALMKSVSVVPLGSASVSLHAGTTLAYMASGIFMAGLQLAAPVLAAALMVEVAVGLVGRLAPALPAQIASIPLKTMVCYVVLVGSLAVWPSWIEHRFAGLLDTAVRGMRT